MRGVVPQPQEVVGSYSKVGEESRICVPVVPLRLVTDKNFTREANSNDNYYVSRPPFESRSPLGLGIPLVAIASALGIGAYVNRDGRHEDRRPGFHQSGPMRPPGFGVSVVRKETGTGSPKKGDGSDAFPSQLIGSGNNAAWARFDFVGSPNDMARFQRSATTSLRDENGKPWPFDELWLLSSVYLAVPRGYDAPPKKLTACVNVSSHEFASQSVAELPPPKPLRHEDASSDSWPGLIAESCKSPADQDDSRQILIDAPMPAGHILAGRLLGTSYTATPLNWRWGLKGPDPGTYLQTLYCPLRYPHSRAKAFVEVVDYAPMHVHKQLHFTGVPYVEKFGSLWIIGPGQDVPFEGETSFRISGIDSIPYRPGQHTKQAVVLQLESDGLVRHVRAKLLSPTTAMSIPFIFRSRTFNLGDIEISKPDVNWTSGPLEFDMDIEADVYRPIRKKTVAVDLSKTRTISTPSQGVHGPFAIIHRPRRTGTAIIPRSLGAFANPLTIRPMSP